MGKHKYNTLFTELAKEAKKKIFEKLPKLHSCIYLLGKDYFLILTEEELTQEEKDYYLKELGIINHYPYKFELKKKCELYGKT
jgi:hypothetical protein